MHALISQLVIQRKGKCNNRGWYLDFEKGKCLGGILDWVKLWPFIFFMGLTFNSLTFQINQLSHERFGLCEMNY